MEEKTGNTVSFIAFESMKATLERTIRRLWILALVLIILLFGTNAAWIYYENSFADETITQEVWQDAENGVNRFVGGDYYGSTESEDYAKAQDS